MVVRRCVPCYVRSGPWRSSRLSNSPYLVGVYHRCSHLHCVDGTHRHGPSYHKYPDRPLCLHRAYLLVYAALTPARPDDFQELRLHGHVPGHHLLSRSQAHYMKVPPRTLFWGQAVASLWNCLVQVCVLYWAFGHIDGICSQNQSGRFTCPNGHVFFNQSIIWGLVGPQRIFSGDGIYASLQYFWIIGALLPVVFFILAKNFPHSAARYLNAPVIFGGPAYIPP